MDEKNALNILTLFKVTYGKYIFANCEGIDKALQVALDDIALVMNILSIYNDNEIYGDYLGVLDDVIKAFIEQRRASNEDSKH